MALKHLHNLAQHVVRAVRVHVTGRQGFLAGSQPSVLSLRGFFRTDADMSTRPDRDAMRGTLGTVTWPRRLGNPGRLSLTPCAQTNSKRWSRAEEERSSY